MKTKKNCLAVLFLLLVHAANAAEIAGVRFDETIRLSGDPTPLVLNGAGIRTKFLLKIYVAALYLPSKSTSVAEILAMPGPKRVAMHFLYKEVEKEKMVEAWDEGFENNQSAESLAKLKSRLDEFNAMFETLHEGDVVFLDFVPGKGTVATFNEKVRGSIPGDDFYRAILEVWLGKSPADSDLKEGMLGG